MRIVGIMALIILAQLARAQFTFRVDQSIPVIKGDGELSLAWAGGLNAAQINTMDLNHDGKEDLVIFDRTTNRVLTLIQHEARYQYTPAYEVLFPAEVSSWLLLRDYDADGRKDLFTADNLGMRVYRNTTPPGALPQWEHVLFYTGFPGPKSEALLTKGLSFKINLQLNHDDLPAFVDADGDGDLDIFNPSYASSGAIEFHKNMSMERYGKPDSLDFERVTSHWAAVTDCGCGTFSFQGESCDQGGRLGHAGGKSLLVMDVDGDGDYDVLFSESNCNQLYLLRNNGSNAEPLVTTAIPYPPNSPASMVNYPTAYYEDVDFDGKKDLLVSPNLFTRESLQNNFRESLWLYKNTGSTNAPAFAAPNRDFLQENMIDVGDNAVPAFFDVDADGDLDLFIGNYGNNFRASIFYYENIGSASAPAFKFITDDFLGLSFLNFVNVRPYFADLNGDTRQDLAFTATPRFGGPTQLFYFPNNNSVGGNFSQELTGTGFYLLPFETLSITDVDLDGKPDLLVGKQNASIAYWRNTGTSKASAWSLEDESFLGLGFDAIGQYPVCAFGDLDADGKTDLIIGDQRGVLTVISNYREPDGGGVGTSDLLYNPLLEANTTHHLGGRIWPAVANIFRTDKPAVVVGNVQGGLYVLKHDGSTPLPASPRIDVYPNPVLVKVSATLHVKVDRPSFFQIITPLGQDIGQSRFLQAFQDYPIELPNLKGIYLLRFYIQGKSYTRKILVD
jgi:hypothetical protein